ncbi:MAG: hypothetical protein MN733_43700, partial [Nitrososphaera sp.]|nr:hypothetical protein [Nitrososphaera sp.]
SGDGLNDLWSLSATKPQELYDMLLVHTALGHTAWIWDEGQRPKCRFKVRIVGGDGTVVESGNIGFPFVPKTAANVFDYEEYRKKNTLQVRGILLSTKSL